MGTRANRKGGYGCRNGAVVKVAGLKPWEISIYGNAIGVCWEGTSHNDVLAIIDGYGLDDAAVRRTIVGEQRRGWPRLCRCEKCWPPGTQPASYPVNNYEEAA